MNKWPVIAKVKPMTYYIVIMAPNEQMTYYHKTQPCYVLHYIPIVSKYGMILHNHIRIFLYVDISAYLNTYITSKFEFLNLLYG